MKTYRLLIVHRDPERIESRTAGLKNAGHELRFFKDGGAAGLRELLVDAPDAAVIDLSRAPGCNRDVAIWLRTNKSSRSLPLVMAGGDADRTAAVRKFLPDAVYSPWDSIEAAVEKAVKTPPARPVVPESTMVAYAGRPLLKKLGIKAGSTVALLNAPENFLGTLGELPDGVVVRRDLRTAPDTTLWFIRSQRELARGIGRISRAAGHAALWIVSPTKSAGTESDLSQTIIRRIALDNGLVDYKVCSVDSTWSGLLFTLRKT